MGVKDLWSILEPISERRPLSYLSGRSVAVDLGFWVCQMQTAVQTNNCVSKIYLRNLFFRIGALLRLNISLVFVSDGKPPELKWGEMHKRQNDRRVRNGKEPLSKCASGKRTKFQACLKECAQMIKMLGLTVIQSDGEAEATCAALNLNGMVDGVITDDSDAFLYGARCVLRNFSLEGKEPMIDCYDMDKIELLLDLDRKKLIAFGLLLGCDFCPKGVEKVGKEIASKFIRLFDSGQEVLERMFEWRKCMDGSDLPLEELSVRNRALKQDDFPNKKVIAEFLHKRSIPVDANILKWLHPSLVQLQEFLFSKIEWSFEYTISKVVPLITLWNLRTIDSENRTLQPERVLKERIKCGIKSLEIQWKKLAYDTTTIQSYYVTLENETNFVAIWPELLSIYYKEKIEKKKSKTKKKSKKQAVDYLKTPTVDEVCLNDSLSLIPDEVDEVIELETSFISDNASRDTENNDDEGLCAQLETLHIEKEVTDSPLPLFERLKLRLARSDARLKHSIFDNLN